jgi:hypothetical protein
LVVEIEHDVGLHARAVRFTSALSAAGFLSKFAAEPSNLLALRGLLRTRLHLETARLSDAEILDRVARYLAGGRLHLVPRPMAPLPVWNVDTSEEPAPVERRVPIKEKTWIEIELLDMEGNPVPGEPYWIELPDGSVREGRLNAKGRAYFDGLDPGTCEVRWPRLDDSATQNPASAPKARQAATVAAGQGGVAAGVDPAREAAERAVAAEEAAGRPAPWTSPRRERDWIEIELLDMDDQPVPGEPYWIKLTDGSIREGTLDSDGRAYFGDLDAGICEVRWPGLDDSAREHLH